MSKINLKTPISYYDGKQRFVTRIVALIPSHTLYCEPFLGGAAVFFAKKPSKVEVLNDTNKELMNFYRTAKDNFAALEKEIRLTLHSQDLHRKASVIYNFPEMFDEVKRAWAVWVLSAQSFCAQLDACWGYDKLKDTTTRKIINRRDNFTEELCTRLQRVQLACADALHIIASRDTEDSFFYCDPPYFNSDCGHYDGYSEQDFENLLKSLSTLRGKFLLSSYPPEILLSYAKANGWHMWSVERGVSINVNNRRRSLKRKKIKMKVEVLTANYPIDDALTDVFLEI